MQLQDLQRLFQNRVLHGQPGIETELAGSATDDSSDRLATYTDGYRSRLLEALSTTFPALKAALGDIAFERAMWRFIEAAPSRHFSIRYYGHSLPGFILAARAEPDARVMHDLARWEWVLAEVFDAPDDAPIGAELLTGIAPEAWPALIVSLRTSVRSITTHTNAVQWWRWARDDGVKPSALELAPASSWRLWRQGVRTLFRSMDACEAATLAVAQRRGTFGEICESIAEAVGAGEAPLRAASILKDWFADQIVVDISIDPGSDTASTEES